MIWGGETQGGVVVSWDQRGDKTGSWGAWVWRREKRCWAWEEGHEDGLEVEGGGESEYGGDDVLD